MGHIWMGRQIKSRCCSLNFIEQTVRCDHKPRAAWVFVRLLLHRRSAAGWAECIDTFRSRAIFLVPIFCWAAEGDVVFGFGTGVAGLGCVLPRCSGSGKRVVAHKAERQPILNFGVTIIIFDI